LLNFILVPVGKLHLAFSHPFQKPEFNQRAISNDRAKDCVANKFKPNALLSQEKQW